MNIHKILEDDNLEARFDGILDYAGEVCGAACGIDDHFDLKKANESRQHLHLQKIASFISHYPNNHTVGIGPAVRFALYGNKFGWCLSLDIQLTSGRLEFLETLWCNIEKLQDFAEHLRNFMRSDGNIDKRFADFLVRYFGRNPDYYSAY